MILPESPLLARLSTDERTTLLGHLEPVDFPAHADVLHHGAAAHDGVYFVLEGTARAFRGDTTLGFAEPGDLFGELGLLTGRVRGASVEAMTPLRCGRLSIATFDILRRESPNLALELVLALVGRVSDGLVELTGAMLPLLRGRGTARSASINVRVGGETRAVHAGTCVVDALGDTDAVAAVVHGRAVPLDTPLFTDTEVTPLTLASWEGRDVYRRSAALLLLEAARRVDPSRTVQIAQSLSSAQVVQVTPNHELPAFTAALERELRAMVHEDVPLGDEHWSVDEARVWFAEHGPAELARLLLVWRTTTVRLARAGETLTLYSGPLLLSAGRLGEFRIEVLTHGLVLDHGAVIGPHLLRPGEDAAEPVALERRAPRFGAAMTLEHRSWLSALGVASVGTYNELCIQRRDAELIRASEGFHEKHIGRLADQIASRRGQLRVIAVAGPSSSGKTTFIRRLTVQLQVNGLRTVGLGLDDYYRGRADVPHGIDGKPDFEAWTALDGALARAEIAALVAGHPTEVARYNFLSGLPGRGPVLHLGADDVLLIEGIHGLNPLLIDGLLAPEAVFRIFIHPATTLAFDRNSIFTPTDLRLLRRIVRDRHRRGSDAADTIRRWPGVRRGERLHIYPQLPFADAVFDSALVYEPSVLKLFAEQYLLEVGRDDPAYPTAYRLRHLLDRFVSLYPDPVPSTSILREFIGGSGFE